MGISAAEEKRQEEKRTKELREFQRASPANRRCFDCNEMMPQYICLDFNTFVCTSCSGIHREFAHRVKSLSMSKFTEAEVKAMKLGGNDAAQKYWRAKHDPSFRPHGGTDGERTRNFMRLTYIDRKWVYESPRESKKDDARRTSSGGSSRSKASFTAPSDDFFGTSSKRSPASPAFDAFGSSDTSASSGFAQFGDFAAFGAEASSASASASGFADFGNFDTVASSSSSSNGFGDFGAFSVSSTPSPGPAPALRSDFGSFKIAPPPGASFGSSTGSSPSSSFSAPTPAPAPAPVPAPIVASPVKQAPSDFMAFSPDKVVKDPFGFDDAPVAAAAAHAPVPSSPFDAFGAAPSPATSRSRGSSATAFDAFGTSASASSSTGGFDAFGSGAASANASLAFDAFGSTPSPAAMASPFDAFGSPVAAAPAAQATPFDAFGGDFGSSATNSRASSGSTFTSATGAPTDPFSAFSPRVSSGSSKTPEPAAAAPAAADPFAAFDEVDAAPLSNTSSTTGSFGHSTGASSDAFGASVSHAPAQSFAGTTPHAHNAFDLHAPAAVAASDPFAFAGVTTSTGSGSASKNNSFGASGGAAHQPNSAFASGFGGAGANPFQPQQQQQTFQPMYNPMFMQQQQHPGQQPQSFQQQQQHLGQQQQWFGHAQQQQHPGPFQQAPGPFPHQQQQQQHGGAPNGMPPALPVHTKPATETPAALNDPFAALNIGLGSASSAAPSSRGTSFEQRKSGSASGSFSNGHGVPSPFTQSRQNSGSATAAGAGANAFGGMSAFPSAAPTSNSRGNSFKTQHAPGAEAFGAPQSNASPMGSFSYGAAPPAAPQAMAFPGPSQSPMGSFSSAPAQTPAPANAFGDNAFGAFASAPSRADSFKGPTSSSAAAANPFDMF